MSAPDTNARSPAPRTTITCTSGSVGERAEDARHRDLHVVRHRVEPRRVVVRHPADAVLHVGEHLLGAGVDGLVIAGQCSCHVVRWSRPHRTRAGRRSRRRSSRARPAPRACARRRPADPSARVAGVSLNVSGGRSTSMSPRVGCVDPPGQLQVLHLRIGEHLVDREHRAARHVLGQPLDPLRGRAGPQQPRRCRRRARPGARGATRSRRSAGRRRARVRRAARRTRRSRAAPTR